MIYLFVYSFCKGLTVLTYDSVNVYKSLKVSMPIRIGITSCIIEFIDEVKESRVILNLSWPTNQQTGA